MWYMLPGMGADARMFQGKWETLPNSRAVNWPKYEGERSLREVAVRIIEEHGIRDGDSLVGTSLGGMVSCEIAGLIKIEHLVLIGSAVHPSEVSSILKHLAPLAPVAPFSAIKFSSGSIPTELGQMFSKAEVAFVRHMIPAIFAWEGMTSKPAHLWRIHGTGDLVIPCPVKPDLAINGGHLLPLTHEEPCVEFVRRLQKGEAPSRHSS